MQMAPMDTVSTETRSRMMAAVKGKDTKPEILVRRTLHRLGFRFRLQARDLPGRPDIVLPRHRLAVFVNGCFWHGHDCPAFRLPSTRTGFWAEKIGRNRDRDARSAASLEAAGWRVLVVWECVLTGKRRLPPERLAEALAEAVAGGGRSTTISGCPMPDPTPS